jgi:hypothetical protein
MKLSAISFLSKRIALFCDNFDIKQKLFFPWFIRLDIYTPVLHQKAATTLRSALLRRV